jgi:nicotinamide riboside transporter PnuC
MYGGMERRPVVYLVVAAFSDVRGWMDEWILRHLIHNNGNVVMVVVWCLVSASQVRAKSTGTRSLQSVSSDAAFES